MATLQQRTGSSVRYGIFAISLAAILWGTVGIATQAIFQLAATDPLSIGLLRLGIAGPILLIVSWLTLGRRMFQIAGRDAAAMLLIGATMAAYQVSFFAAIARIGVTMAVLITLCCAPMFVALGAWIFLRETLTRWHGYALVGALCGTTLLVGGEAFASSSLHTLLVGALLAGGASLGFALMTLSSRALAGRYHPLVPMAWGLTLSALLLLPFGLFQGIVLDYPLGGWLTLLYLGMIPTALAFVIFLVGMQHVSATAASIVTLLEPLTATLLAWVLFGEQLGALGWLGAVLLLGAVALLSRER
jgi:DME family drug/metabolite transporter